MGTGFLENAGFSIKRVSLTEQVQLLPETLATP